MVARVWVVCLALLGVAALVCEHTAAQAIVGHPASEFAGTDYGDLIDELRARVDEDSYNHNDGNPGRMGHIRGLLNKIKRDIEREQSAADLIFRSYTTEYLDKNYTLNFQIANTSAWLAKAVATIDFNEKRIMNLTVWLTNTPAKIPVQRELVKSLEIKIEGGQKIRDTANARFLAREQATKDVITAARYILDQLGGVVNTTERYNTDLVKALNKDNKDPKFRSLMDSLNMDTMRLRSSEDINKIRTTLTELKTLYSMHLRQLVDVENRWLLIWQSKKAALTKQLDDARAKLDFFIKSIPDSQAEIKTRAAESSQLAVERPGKITTLDKAKFALDRLTKERTPLAQQYSKHQLQRSSQLNIVNQLLEIIHKRYDGNNLAS